MTLAYDRAGLGMRLSYVWRDDYAFGDAGGPTTHNFGTTLVSRSFALGFRWRL